MQALLKEIKMQASFLEAAPVHTIYFGGGTPSLVDPEMIQAVIQTIHQHYIVASDAEITLEANPDDFSPARTSRWAAMDINRLSIGIQSFFPEDLSWMNRAHTAPMGLQAIETAQQAGIHNISIDLIYGGPTLSDAAWKENIHIAHNAGITHLSCYALTVEPATALDVLINKGAKQPVDQEKQARHFSILQELAVDLGYEHYEISNFAKPGYRSKHNSSYWAGTPYLGIGPSAHSFNGTIRKWNISNNALYLKAINNDTIPFEEEILTNTNRINEYIMTSLRTIEGLSFEKLQNVATSPQIAHIKQEAVRHIHRGHLTMTDAGLMITNTGKFFADGIAADLFIA